MKKILRFFKPSLLTIGLFLLLWFIIYLVFLFGFSGCVTGDCIEMDGGTFRMIPCCGKLRSSVALLLQLVKSLLFPVLAYFLACWLSRSKKKNITALIAVAIFIFASAVIFIYFQRTELVGEQTPQPIPHDKATSEVDYLYSNEPSEINIVLDKKEYHPGETMWIMVVVTNETKEKVKSELFVELVTEDPMTKMFGDERTPILRKVITVDPQKVERVKTNYKLPLELSSTNLHNLEVNFSDKHDLLSFELTPFFQWSLEMPDVVQEGQRFTAELTLVNNSDVAIKNIRVNLSTPFDIDTLDSEQKNLSKLPPSTTQLLSWQLKALSESEVSQLVFNVMTENGGGVDIFEGVTIKERAD